MELKKYVTVLDNVVSPTQLSSLLKWCNKIDNEFYDAGVVKDSQNTEDFINKEIRNTNTLPLHTISQSLTNVHWNNYLCSRLNASINEYVKKNDFVDISLKEGLTSLGLLKYEKGGFYKFHVDHCGAIPRTLSLILFLNNDYKGGQLCFKDPGNLTTNEFCVGPKPGRLIIWPSNFLYPHAVKPVEEGVRYTVVGWAL